MHDDDPSLDADRRLQSVLRPDDGQVSRLLGRVLSERPDAGRARRTVWATACGTAAVVVALSVALWWGARPIPEPWQITGTGSVIVVTRPDGGRLVFGTPAGTPTRGDYVIAFPPSER